MATMRGAGASLSFELDAKDFDKLWDAFLKLGEPLEKALDKAMWPVPAQRTMNKVHKYMPFSGRSEVGARVGGSLQPIDLYMGFVVKTRKVTGYKRGNRYGYLFFPETGTGYTQKNTGAQRFFYRAIEEEKPKITNEVLATVNKMLVSARLK